MKLPENKEFDKEQAFEDFMKELAELNKFTDNPIRMMKETIKLSDFLENIYNQGLTEGKRLKLTENN